MTSGCSRADARSGRARDNDYRLRCAPERFSTRVFRDLTQDFNNIEETASLLDFDRFSDTVSSVTDALKVIIDVSRKMQGIGRRVKKDIKHHDNQFWSKLDARNTLRSTA